MSLAGPPSLSPNLAQALKVIVAATARSRDPWWVIGSSAMVLHGVADVDPADVDLMLSPRDARHLLQAVGEAVESRDKSDRFYSQVFARLTDSGLPIEILGGFHVRQGGEWVALALESREEIILPFGSVYVPALAELMEITRMFGRPKDLVRVGLMEAHLRA